MLAPGEYYCDLCDKKHDVLYDHCEKGEHCIGTDATCSADWQLDDHYKTCCVCGDLIPELGSYQP